MYQKLLDKKLSLKGQVQPQQNRPTMKEKTEQLRKEVQAKEMKECTFKPHTNLTQGDHRSTEAFVKDQAKYVSQKNNKIEEMRSLIQATRTKENTFQPNAASKNHQHIQDGNRVHDRLYQDAKKS